MDLLSGSILVACLASLITVVTVFGKNIQSFIEVQRQKIQHTAFDTTVAHVIDIIEALVSISEGDIIAELKAKAASGTITQADINDLVNQIITDVERAIGPQIQTVLDEFVGDSSHWIEIKVRQVLTRFLPSRPLPELVADSKSSDVAAPAVDAPASTPAVDQAPAVDATASTPAVDVTAVDQAPAVAAPASTPAVDVTAVDQAPAVAAPASTPAVDAPASTPAVDQAPAVAVPASTPAVDAPASIPAVNPATSQEQAPQPVVNTTTSSDTTATQQAAVSTPVATDTKSTDTSAPIGVVDPSKTE